MGVSRPYNFFCISLTNSPGPGLVATASGRPTSSDQWKAARVAPDYPDQEHPASWQSFTEALHASATYEAALGFDMICNNFSI